MPTQMTDTGGDVQPSMTSVRVVLPLLSTVSTSRGSRARDLRRSGLGVAMCSVGALPCMQPARNILVEPQPAFGLNLHRHERGNGLVNS